jgi:choline transport protein
MLFSIIGTMSLALSLAEMASICPIAGAQYHWTAMFAPPKIKNFITWMQGMEQLLRAITRIAADRDSKQVG